MVNFTWTGKNWETANYQASFAWAPAKTAGVFTMAPNPKVASAIGKNLFFQGKDFGYKFDQDFMIEMWYNLSFSKPPLSLDSNVFMMLGEYDAITGLVKTSVPFLEFRHYPDTGVRRAFHGQYPIPQFAIGVAVNNVVLRGDTQGSQITDGIRWTYTAITRKLVHQFHLTGGGWTAPIMFTTITAGFNPYMKLAIGSFNADSAGSDVWVEGVSLTDSGSTPLVPTTNFAYPHWYAHP
jgi:hypothetical protein